MNLICQPVQNIPVQSGGSLVHTEARRADLMCNANNPYAPKTAARVLDGLLLKSFLICLTICLTFKQKVAGSIQQEEQGNYYNDV
jgi:hypothetical protein